MERQASSSRSGRKTVGCMSAIFRLLSRHHKRTKLLTSGKEQQKKAAVPQSPMEALVKRQPKAVKLPSPKLPEEMRRSKSFEIPPHAHALVVRLMGIESFPVSVTQTQESIADKRMKLLRALEQCDEELKTLQRITQVVNNRRLGHQNGRTIRLQAKQTLKTKPGEEEITATAIATGASFYHRFTKEFVSDAESNNHEDQNNSINANAVSTALWRISKAMVESVEEVCKDIAWGEKREIGRIGLALQDHICRDLIDEIVTEIWCFSNVTYSLPFQACKRGLSF